MLGVENLKPIEWTNSLLNPLGLQVSNRKQIISKIALATLAILAIYNALPEAEATSPLTLAMTCNKEGRAIYLCQAAYRNRLNDVTINRSSRMRSCLNSCIATLGPTRQCNHERFSY